MVSLINIYDWDKTIFDSITLPEGVDKETLVNEILLEAGELSPIFTNPEAFKNASKIWFDAHRWNIEKLIALIAIQYDPLENYNRYEDLERNFERGEQESHTGTSTDSGSISSTSTNSTGTTAENTVSADNASTYQPSDKTATSTSSTGTTSGTSGNTTTRALADTAAITEDETHDNHIHGNIGVMSTQQMFTQELDLLNRFNLYQWIAKQFIIDNFVCVW